MPETQKEVYEIQIRKEALKFASSHMTVFPDGTKEAIHGHHYVPTIKLQVKNVNFDQTILFSEIKTAMKKISALWDEKLLLAMTNPYFKIIQQSAASIHFELCKKFYAIPADEVVALEIDNVTCENLAKAYFEFLEMELELLANPNILSLSVFIEESPGQGASFTHAKS